MNARINPLLSPSALLLAALSLSIGWGIRGQFGHELGAMFPGALTAIAVCVVSGRRDWLERLAYFAFFGAVGWGFGGSCSYGQVIGFSHSEQLATQYYGFFALFSIGFLWGSLGCAATALPAVWDRKQLTDFFKPFAFVFVAQVFLYLTLEPFETFVQFTESATKRHESSLYWYDTDWIPFFFALIALLIYDLAERRLGKFGHLFLYSGIGAVAGFAIKLVLDFSGLSGVIGSLLLRYEGDQSLYALEQLLSNWPLFIVNHTAHIGWALGLIIGIGYYFYRYGVFRHGASFMMHLVIGWFACFIILTVLLGMRMTPPRSDSWAGVLGVVLGAGVYFWRQRSYHLLTALVVGGFIGGIGFSGASWVRLYLVSYGSPSLISDPEILKTWQYYQLANWHSVLEQTYGFINGIAVVVVIALLVKRVAPLDDSAPRKRWTEAFALLFALPILSYVNMVKNMEDWSRVYQGKAAIPEMMKAPLIQWIELSSMTWFNIMAGAVIVASLILMIVHCRRPIALLSMNWIGRGQLAFLLLLWTFVIGNTVKQFPFFAEGRLVTEFVIVINAVIVTLMILIIPKESEMDQLSEAPSCRPMFIKSLILCLIVVLTVPAIQTYTMRLVYKGNHAGHSGLNYRFGEKANWRVKPLLKGEEHR